MNGFAGMTLMVQAPEWARGFLGWVGRTGWFRLGHLLLVAVACFAILGAVKLIPGRCAGWWTAATRA